MRRVTSRWSLSLNSAGAVRALLSMNSVTSAVLRAGRSCEPAKITSSMAAQRLKQVRLAAAVGSNHAGQAGFDQELGWLDKGFEAEKAEASDFHVSEALEALDISFTRQMVNA